MIRWLRWNLVCRRGRRCAYLAVEEDSYESRFVDVDGYEVEVEGIVAVVVLEYDCGGCGTHYRDEVLLGESPVSLGRERVRR